MVEMQRGVASTHDLAFKCHDAKMLEPLLHLNKVVFLKQLENVNDDISGQKIRDMLEVILGTICVYGDKVFLQYGFSGVSLWKLKV